MYSRLTDPGRPGWTHHNVSLFEADVTVYPILVRIHPNDDLLPAVHTSHGVLCGTTGLMWEVIVVIVGRVGSPVMTVAPLVGYRITGAARRR